MIKEKATPWESQPILAGYRGSIAHGTQIPLEDGMGTDDVDYFYIEVHTPEFYLGMPGYLGKEVDYEYKDDKGVDIKGYDVRKFFHLLNKGNPNVHAWLWTKPEDITHCDHRGNMLLEERESFLSTRLFKAIFGYAKGQLKKMTSGSVYAGYMGAKRKRNYEKFGYDVKNAAHCLRLLLMGEYLAQTGELMVNVTDHKDYDLLMSIKKGEVPYADFVKLLPQYIEDFRKAKANCTFLPDTPQNSDELLVDIINNTKEKSVEFLEKIRRLL
jgi:predicted nucleotidyltransferase